ncbi:hypothetical protein D9611_002374 [Ephemerocybe angulata]|uniref:Endoglucanase n=1 Tax=Ephemerocybe angulata TaxID=980116 RepID=A0A8H5FDT3_9AGAR|nr:hypothetical protein D9611_002374 [Tulosesus angulatus]
MWFSLLALTLHSATALVAAAQLALPNPPWLPPDLSEGAKKSNESVPNPQWSTLLGNALYFYEAQRSGELPSTKRVSWRNASTLDDGKSAHVDLSGGYYDAGDFSKQTLPLAFTLMSVCWGATDFGKGYDMANQTAYLDDMLRWGLDWLIQAHPSDSVLYVLVGNKDIENTYWGGDRTIPSPRPVYQINDTAPGTDVAAQTAAAFAACSNLYASRSFDSSSFSTPATLQDKSYADTLLTHAQQLYKFAVNASGGRKVYQKSVPEVAASYASTEYGDDLAIAALFLAWATNDAALYQEAEGYYDKYKLQEDNRLFNWDTKTPGLPVLFSQIAKSNPNVGGNLGKWQDAAEAYFDSIVNNKDSPAFMTTGGLVYFEGNSDDNSINPALNLAMLLRRYSTLTTSSDKKSKYLDFSQKQLDYVLGDNPMSMPYVVGVNPNSPAKPHSALAHGGNDVGEIDTNPEKNTYTLYGAVVGGPDRWDRYFDIRSDWPQAEIALDYNAPLLTLAAMHTLADSKDPFYTTLQAGEYDKVKPDGLPCDAAFPQGCKGPALSKGGKIAMAVVIVVASLIVLGLSAYYVFLLIRNAKEGTV